MPFLRGAVDAEGALVDVQFGWSGAAIRQLRAGLRPIPQAVTARAVIDSGAQVTCLDSSLLHALGLPWRGMTSANVPAIGGLSFRFRYDAALTILHPSGNASDNLTISDLLVIEVPLGALGFQALIGRDVLAKCRLVYDGPGSWFELTY